MSNAELHTTEDEQDTLFIHVFVSVHTAAAATTNPLLNNTAIVVVASDAADGEAPTFNNVTRTSTNRRRALRSRVHG